MAKIDLPDQASRDKIEKDLDRCLMVEAGAGSGKTTSMVNRMISLLETGKATIDSMVAVTFTRKAALELREKFQEKIEGRLLEIKTSSKGRQYLAKALSFLEQANISTIHSFCSKILLERPVEAGVDPDFTILEEIDDEIMAEDFWHQYMDDNPQLHEIIEELGCGIEECYNAYRFLRHNPDVDFPVTEREKPDLSTSLPILRQKIDKVIEMMPNDEPVGGWDDLQRKMREADRTLSLQFDNEQNIIETLRILNTWNRKGTRDRWQPRLTKEEVNSLLAEVSGFIDENVVPRYDSWLNYRYSILMPVLKSAAAAYREYRLAESLLNNNDLLLLAAKLFRDNKSVREYFHDRFSHLLVDEFQDTDPVQAEIMFLLTCDNLSISDWRKSKPRAGSLFIVGDPKQSIYRFRRADISIYNITKEILTKSGGELVELTANFRSTSDIISFVNTTFVGIFPKSATEYQAAHAEMSIVKESESDLISGIYRLDTQAKKNNDIFADNAAQIASWVVNSLDSGMLILDLDNDGNSFQRPCQPQDFMVLTPEKDELDYYVRAFSERGIPAQVEGAKSNASNVFIFEALKILKAIAEPEDPVKILAVLRGLFFGLSDQDLYDHTVRGGNWDIANIEAGLPATISVMKRIRKYHELSKQHPCLQAIHSIIDDIAAIEFSAFAKDINGDPGSFFHALELLSHHINKDGLTFPRSIAKLESLLQLDLESANMHTGIKDSALIANLHKAKGLEAPVVFLADPCSHSKHDPLLHISRNKKIPAGYLQIAKKTHPMSNNYETLAKPSGWKDYEKDESSFLEEERKRFIYVAATRAKQILVISTKNGSCEKSGWSLLDANIESVPNLPTMPSAPKPKLSKSNAIPGKFLAELDSLSCNLSNRRKKQSSQSYSVKAVRAMTVSETPVSTHGGRGPEWGELVHRVLELASKHPTSDMKVFALSELESSVFPIEEQDELFRNIDAVINSSIWARAMSSEMVLAETPFTVSSPKQKEVLSGEIDLLFRENGFWVIVDYKSDAVDGNLDDLVQHYQGQISTYATCWQQCVGEPVREAYLFFTSTGDIVPVDHLKG